MPGASNSMRMKKRMRKLREQSRNRSHVDFGSGSPKFPGSRRGSQYDLEKDLENIEGEHDAESECSDATDEEHEHHATEPEGPTPRTQFAMDKLHHERTRVRITLEKDLRMNAWIQMIGVPKEWEEEHEGKVYHTVAGGLQRYVPFCVVLVVSCLQLLMAYTTYCYVNNNFVRTFHNPMLTAYELYVASNTTIDKGLVNDLCGDWENMETPAGGNGPLAHVKMPDGSIYDPDPTYNMFYNMKQPFRDYNYATLGVDGRSVMDNVLYVIHEGLTINPFGGGAGYSMLFITMIIIWIFAIMIEFRTGFHNLGLAVHFQDDPDAVDNWELDGQTWKLTKLPWYGRAVIFCNIATRFLVAGVLAAVGCYLLMYTTGKMDLILNALAVLFVLEIDTLLYFATITNSHQQFVDDVDPVTVKLPQSSVSLFLVDVSSYALPLVPILGTIGLGIHLRRIQLQSFKAYFRITSAMCLFAGPTPGDEPGLMAPAAGFCDSLLGATCSPKVTPASTLQQHGRCVLTDQRIATVGSTFYYMDEPTLFAGRHDQHGVHQSWAKWGDGLPEMYEKGIWNVGPYQDKMRKNCLQMYQAGGNVESRILDSNTGETLPGAPFYCSKDKLWKAVFGKFTEGRKAATDITMENMMLVADLEDPEVVAAIDACAGSTRKVSPHKDRLHMPSLMSKSAPPRAPPGGFLTTSSKRHGKKARPAANAHRNVHERVVHERIVHADISSGGDVSA